MWRATPGLSKGSWFTHLSDEGGKLYAWNGVGQSIVMIPADVFATGAARRWA